MVVGLELFQIKIWENFLVCVNIWVCDIFVLCLKYFVSMISTSEPWGLLLELTPNRDLENRKLQSPLAERYLRIVISNHDLEIMISGHGYLKSYHGMLNTL